MGSPVPVGKRLTRQGNLGNENRKAQGLVRGFRIHGVGTGRGQRSKDRGRRGGRGRALPPCGGAILRSPPQGLPVMFSGASCRAFELGPTNIKMFTSCEKFN